MNEVANFFPYFELLLKLVTNFHTEHFVTEKGFTSGTRISTQESF